MTPLPIPWRLSGAIVLLAAPWCAAGGDWSLDAAGVTDAARTLGGRIAVRTAAIQQSAQMPPPPGPRRINQGFEALGPAGSRGEVDGPLWKANGRYEVLRNDPFELHVKIKTGYVDGQLRLLLDIDNRTWLGFHGTVNDPRRGKTYTLKNWAQIRLEYYARRDEGTFNWTENGKAKSERFSGGTSGRDMTIELAGGWGHIFRRDKK